LKALFENNEFNAKPMPLPVYGPYHAAHLHSAVEIETMLRLDDEHVMRVFQNSVPRFPVMSCSTGQWIAEKETRGLFLAIVRDILDEPLQFHRVLSSCVTQAQNYRGSRCLVIPFGPTHAANSLTTLLKSQTDLDVLLRRAPHSTVDRAAPHVGDHGSAGKVKLAIVGMAGRFPDAATHEKLWELLEKGLDVHREVNMPEEV
jgi:hypothetical protein